MPNEDTFTYQVTVPKHAEDHESFMQKIKDGLKTAGMDVLEVVLFPLAVATGIHED